MSRGDVVQVLDAILLLLAVWMLVLINSPDGKRTYSPRMRAWMTTVNAQVIVLSAVGLLPHYLW